MMRSLVPYVTESEMGHSDYDKTDRATGQFFAAVQNCLLYAVTKQTAAETKCYGTQKREAAKNDCGCAIPD